MSQSLSGSCVFWVLSEMQGPCWVLACFLLVSCSRTRACPMLGRCFVHLGLNGARCSSRALSKKGRGGGLPSETLEHIFQGCHSLKKELGVQGGRVGRASQRLRLIWFSVRLCFIFVERCSPFFFSWFVFLRSGNHKFEKIQRFKKQKKNKKVQEEAHHSPAQTSNLYFHVAFVFSVLCIFTWKARFGLEVFLPPSLPPPQKKNS